LANRPPSPRRLNAIGRGAALPLALLAASCSPLRAFNALVPTDAGVERVAKGAAFGAGPRQRLDLYRPRQQAGPTPVLVFLYGGSWQSGTRQGYGFAGRALAARGFLVAVPDYRLVPDVRCPGFLEDNAAAVRWLRANAARFGGDADRIVLVGHSAGAYNAAMLALDPRWLGKDRSAVRGFVGLAGPYDFLPLDSPITRAAFGAAADASIQPGSFASADDPPALLLHGAKDATVLPRNSVKLAERLRSAGGEAHTKLYPGLGHVGILTSIARPFRGKAPVLDDIARFSRQVTDAPLPRGGGGQAAPWR
jgi:acetyl esterase/lipase